MTASPSAASEFRGTPRFAIEGLLGAGGMGIVYRARDRDSGRAVALKTLAEHDPARLLRFKREFRALAGIAHPNVVRLHELFADAQRWFFTMELVEGVDFIAHARGATHAAPAVTETRASLWAPLGARVTATGDAEEDVPSPLTPAVTPNCDLGRLREATRQLLSGLAAIHRAGRLHRDVKPSNVLVAADGRVVLLDFGVAGELDREETHGPPLLGTPAYMAPEQARGEAATAAADLYAVGVMLHEALTGRLPHAGSASQILESKRRGEAPSLAFPRADNEDHRRLVALAERLLDPRAEARPSADELLAELEGDARRGAWSSPPRDSEFVGRERELAQLRALVARRGSGRARCVLAGPSGIGKSSLARRFVSELQAQSGALVLAGRCYERESVPFKGLDAVLDELSGWLIRRAPEALRREALPLLARVTPLFPGLVDAALEPTRSRAPASAEEARRRAFAALRELFERVQRDRRVVIVLDDLQWADPDCWALLDELVSGSPEAQPIWITTVRVDAEAAPALRDASLVLVDRLERRAGFTVLHLEPLEDADATLLARSVLGAAASDDALAGRIVAEAQRLPFLILELAEWERSRPSSGEGPRGVSLDELLQGRFRELGAAERACLEVLAIANGPIPRQLVADVAAAGDPTPLFGELGAARLVRGVASDERGLVDVYHSSIRDSVRRLLGASQRRAWHAALAQRLDARPDADPGVVFEHFAAAGDRDGARRHVLRAAQQAEQQLAFERAASLYERAVELGADLPRAELERRAAEALLAAGRGAKAAEAFARAAAASEGDARTRLSSAAAEHFLKSGREREGVRLLRRALRGAGLHFPKNVWSAIAELASERARLALRGLGFVERRQPSNSALLRADVAFAAATGLAMVDVVRSAAFGARHLRLALDAGDAVRVCRALAIEASARAAVESPRSRRSGELVTLAERLAHASSDAHATGLAQLAAGMVRVFRGEWRAAARALDAAEPTLRERCRGASWELTNAVAWSMNVLILRGELRVAAARAPGVLREATERGDRFAAMQLVYPAAISAIGSGDPDAAERIARDGERFGAEFSARFTAGHWGALISMGSVRRYRGRGREAHRHFEAEFSRLAASQFLRVHVIRVCSTFERGLCALAALEDGGADAGVLRVAERCRAALRSDSPPYAEALGRYLGGCLAAFEGRAERAAAELARAAWLLESLDMNYLATAARARHGLVIGGSQGAAETARAVAALRSQAVADVEACLAMSAPGFNWRSAWSA